MTSDLYDLCFNAPKPVHIKPDWRAVYGRVLRQIETMELKARARVDLERVCMRGYIVAIHLPGTNLVTICIGGEVPLSAKLCAFKKYVPGPVEIVARHHLWSYDNATAIYEVITRGLLTYKVGDSIWFGVPGGALSIIDMFARLDKYDPESLGIADNENGDDVDGEGPLPELRRMPGRMHR